MFYVANIIILSVVLELLWKFTLLVRHKLNIFRPPRVNQFDICSLLFGGYARFIPLDKMVFYYYWKILPSGGSEMLHTALTLFIFCNGICCILYNSYLKKFNSFFRYLYFYYWLSSWNYSIYLTRNYWRKKLTEMLCDVSS